AVESRRVPRSRKALSRDDAADRRVLGARPQAARLTKRDRRMARAAASRGTAAAGSPEKRRSPGRDRRLSARGRAARLTLRVPVAGEARIHRASADEVDHDAGELLALVLLEEVAGSGDGHVALIASTGNRVAEQAVGTARDRV